MDKLQQLQTLKLRSLVKSVMRNPKKGSMQDFLVEEMK